MNKREIKNTIIEIKEELATELEKVQRYNEAIDIYEEINMPEKAVIVDRNLGC